MSGEHWKHVWLCSEILGVVDIGKPFACQHFILFIKGRFVSCNWLVFRNSYILELGAGATGIPGIVAAKCGAKKVVLTDHPEKAKVFFEHSSV